MPIYSLTEELIFPHPKNSNKHGILAVGGDLSVERLLLAYSNGIFPWFNEDDPIIWWSPKERCVIYTEDIKVSKSMNRLLKKDKYKVTFDTVFEEVIEKCSSIRREAGTWITDDMIRAYTDVYNYGFAHSVEVWFEDELVGGLYGISIGKFFFGESMFSLMPNASKVALIKLSEKIKEMDFYFIDCQMHTAHLESMGAVNITRNKYLKALEEGLKFKTIRGKWN